MKNDLSQYCAPGTKTTQTTIAVAENVELMMIIFEPVVSSSRPPVLFIPGWISQIGSWRNVLLELTRSYTVYYVETREKNTSRIAGHANYGVEDIAADIVAMVEKLGFSHGQYILFGSSLGASAILEAYSNLTTKPLCQILVGPNAVFRVPLPGLIFVYLFPPRLYIFVRPFIKWYLRTFRMRVEHDYAQYAKYATALDAADPWKLKNAMIRLAKYQVWNRLPANDIPTLILGGSHDTLHEPDNLHKMTSMMKHATYVDMETNANTHSAAVVKVMEDFIDELKRGVSRGTD